MKKEVYYLENRIHKLYDYLGLDLSGNNASELTAPKLADKIQEVITKLPKEVQNKYERIKKIINIFSNVSDQLLTEEKIETVQSEEEELNQIAAELQQIDQLSKYLNLEALQAQKKKHSADLELLATTSAVEYNEPGAPLKIIQYKAEDLAQLNQSARAQFQELASFHNKAVAFLNDRIKAINNRITQLEAK